MGQINRRQDIILTEDYPNVNRSTWNRLSGKTTPSGTSNKKHSRAVCLMVFDVQSGGNINNVYGYH